MAHFLATTTTTTNTTKSIDVGSMFLMDLSVHESEFSNGDQSDAAAILDNEHVFPGASFTHLPKSQSTTTSSYKLNENKRSNNYYPSRLPSSSKTTTQNKAHHHQIQPQENLGNSLDRLAEAIYSDGKPDKSITIAEPQPPPEIVEHQQSSPSLSDESFVTSSGSSSEGSCISGDGNSLSSSYTATSCEAGDDDDDDDNEDRQERGSTTTREDSGVLDMKDLDSQLNKSYDYDNQRLKPEKPISNDTTATNLINKSANNHNNKTFNKNPITSSNYHQGHHHHHHHRHNHYHRGHQFTSGREAVNSGKRSVSASLPIQVPARQMKKDLNKLKLDLIRDGSMEATASAATTTIIPSQTSTASNNHKQGNGMNDIMKHSSAASNCAFRHDNQWAIADEFDEFLEQEYNDNHQNHYPIDKYDGENLRAEENPMKLFESIQALARSLHEDAELFGSLPPKRMLESPIRSIALA